MFSARFTWSLDDNSFSRAVRERRATGLPVLDLTESNPTRAGFAWDAAMLAVALASDKNGAYEPEPRGQLSARAAVADYYSERGVAVSPEQIHLTASTSEGYGWLMKLLTNPSNAVLAPVPSYPLLQFLANLEGVAIQPYPLVHDDGRWRVDAAVLERAITPETRAIFCVTPNNPTGSVLDGTDRAVLRDAAQRHRLALIVDEVFLDYGGAGRTVSSWAEETAVPLFVLSGLSKIAALPQVKLGWIVTAGPESWRAEAVSRLDFIADTYLSVNTPVQNGVAALLGAAVPLRGKIQARLEVNEAVLRDWCAGSAHGLRLLEREAGWTALVALPRGVNEEALTLDLVRRDGVVAHPGYFYDMPAVAGPFLVVSLLSNPADLRAAVPLIETALRRH